jgi:hypothetical protein
MKPLYLSMVLAASSALLFPALASATPAVVSSPQTAQTYSDNSMQWHQLRWLPGSQSLVASITFNNVDYASKITRQHEERFDFALPGVKFNQTTGVFYVNGSHGQTIPVAVKQAGPLPSIKLAPGAQIDVHNNAGRINVSLVASKAPILGAHWAEQ